MCATNITFTNMCIYTGILNNVKILAKQHFLPVQARLKQKDE